MKQESMWFTYLTIVLTLVLFSGGCARKNRFGSSGAQGQSAESLALDLSRITIQSSELDSGDPGMLPDRIADRELVLRTETFTNPNDGAVRVWLLGRGTATAFGICTRDRAQYQTPVSDPVPELDAQGIASSDLDFRSLESGWVSFALPAGATVTIRWVSGGDWAWIPGPWIASQQSCNETSPERGWAEFDLNGSFTEAIRFTPSEIEDTEATADERNLKPERVWIVPTVRDSLNLHWGS